MTVPENQPVNYLYQFGPFVVDETRRLLRRGGQIVPLTPKAFEALLVLIQNRERVLEKDELMTQLWPDTVVEENTLARNIHMLRKALGETPNEHRYIITIPGRGYRFAAEVRRSALESPEQFESPVAPCLDDEISPYSGSVRRHEAESASGEKSPVDAPARGTATGTMDVTRGIKRYQKAGLALAAVAMLALGADWGLPRLLSRQSGELFQTMKLKKLTVTGKVRDAAISPDGLYVAYVEEEAGKQGLWLRQIASDQGVQIVSPAEVWYRGLLFSPDGASLYFIKSDGKAWADTLYQMPVLGGVARRIIAGVHSTVTFSPDGKRLAFARDYPDQQESALIVASVDGTGEQRLAVRRMPDSLLTWLGGPAWSPDGKIIANPVVSKAGGMHCELIEVRVSDGIEKTITSQRWQYIGRLAWLPDGSGLTMTATQEVSGNPQLWQLSCTTGEAQRITQDPNQYYGLSMAADASALTAVMTEELTSLWAAPTADTSQAVKVASGSNDTFPGLAWTPDGKIVYASRTSGKGSIWMTGMGEKSPQLLVDQDVSGWPDVSPDGRYIVFASNREGHINVWRVDRDGSNLKQLTNGDYDYQPRCSPDGKWVVYTARGGDRAALMKTTIYGSASIRLAEKIVGQPAISTDGKLIAYCSQYLNQWEVMVIPFEGGTPIKVFENMNSFVQWSPDGQALTLVRTRDGVSNIWSQPLNGDIPKQLSHFTDNQITNFAWSPDGRQLVFQRRTMWSDIVLINRSRRT